MTTWADIQAMEDGTYFETPEEELRRKDALYRQLEMEDEYGIDGRDEYDEYM